MAISWVGDARQAAVDGGNITVDISLIGIVSGDVVVVCLGGASNDGTIKPVISTSGYTLLVDGLKSGTAPATYLTVAYKVQGVTPDTSVSVTGDGNASDAAAAIALVFRGVDNTTVSDQTPTTTTGSSTNPDAPSITTVTNNAAVVACAASRVNDVSITGPSGYSNAQQRNGNDTNPITVGVAWKAITPPGAENPPSWTAWNTGEWSAASIVLRPALPPAGSATLAGAGSLGSTGNVLAAGAAAASGTGNLSSTALLVAQASGIFAGSGALTASATHTPTGAAALSGTGLLSVNASVSAVANLAVAGSGSMNAAATMMALAEAALHGSGTLAADGSITRPGTQGVAILAGVGSLTVLGLIVAVAETLLAGGGELIALGSVVSPISGVAYGVTDGPGISTYVGAVHVKAQGVGRDRVEGIPNDAP